MAANSPPDPLKEEQLSPRSMKKVELKDDDDIAGWKIINKLGEGGFGAVYLVKDKKNKRFALKTEALDAEEDSRVLKMEVVVLAALAKADAKHACAIFDSGRAKGYNYIVMTLVGKSLSELRKTANKGIGRFSPGCAISVGIQCMEALQELHQIGYLHRDVKPGNFAVAKDNPRRVLVLDFGMARRFLEKNKKVRKSRLNPGFRGTPRYAGITCHLGLEMGRKDDLESWLYQLTEMTSGQLPWSELEDLDQVQVSKQNSRTIKTAKPQKSAMSTPEKADSKRSKMKSQKKGLAPLELFDGCPKEYEKILTYLDGLTVQDTPNYGKVKGHLKTALKDNAWKEFPYDWEKLEGSAPN